MKSKNSYINTKNGQSVADSKNIIEKSKLQVILKVQ